VQAGAAPRGRPSKEGLPRQDGTASGVALVYNVRYIPFDISRLW
jgi:hypothetical protein